MDGGPGVIVGMIAGIGGVLADLPDDLDSDEAQNIIVGLLVLCAVGMVIAIRTVQKATTRLLMVLFLAAVAVGFWIQRENLQDCAGQCECRLFGRDLEIADPDESCPT